MNKIIKSFSILSLVLMTLLSVGFVPAQASEQGHWVQKNSGKWYYYYNDGTYAMDTVVDGKYYVYWTGVWDGKTINSSSSTTQKSNYIAQAVNYNIQTNDYNTQTMDAVATNGTISYAEFTKIADDKMLELINAHRQANGATPLVWDQTLADMSTEKSEHMIKHDYTGHSYQGVVSSWVQTIEWRHNIDSENCLTTSQTFSLTKEDAVSLGSVMFNQWKASAGHNANMLDPTWRKFGFGFAFSNGKAMYSSYGTQQFATQHDTYYDNISFANGLPYSMKE